MKVIFTKKGQPIYVDDADYDWLVQWSWCINSHGYAMSHTKQIRGQKRSKITMHRLILGLTDPSIHVDHRNRIKHDNQRHNLRTCTNAQNGRNRLAQRNNKCGYKGVRRRTDTGRWQAAIRCNGVQIHLGSFDSAEAAYAAYCAKVCEIHGEFANYGQIEHIAASAPKESK